MQKLSFTTLLVLLLLTGPDKKCFAQQADHVKRYSDSLLTLVQQADSDSLRFVRYIDLSFFWSDRDTATAFHYIGEAKNAVKNKPDAFQQGLIHLYTANIIFTHNIDLAKREYLLADKYLSSLSTPQAFRYRSKAWNNYGILLQIRDSADEYLRIITDKIIPFARVAGDSNAVGNGLLNIGLLLSNVESHEQAEDYYEQAMNTFARLKGVEESKLTLFVMAAKTAIQSGNLSRSRTYLDSAAAVLRLIPHSFYAAHYYRSEGVYYRKKKLKNEALAMFTKAEKYASMIQDEQVIRDIYFEMFATYRDFNENANAKKYLLLANQHDAASGTPDRLLHLREMAAIDYKLGNFKIAYEQMKAYALGKDTLHEKDIALRIIDLEKKYVTIEKENEILKLKDVNQQQRSTINNHKLLLFLLFAGLVIALLIAFLGWKLAQSHRKSLRQQALLHEQELEKLKQQEQLKQYEAVLHVQEDERNRIARDLHDGLGGLLAGVKLRLSTIATKSREKTGQTDEAVNTVIAELDNSANELRRIARNMMPEALLYMGLNPALEDLCNYLNTTQTAIKYHGIDLRSTYPQHILTNVYRIVQELLNNAIKHANASQIIVQCSEGDEHLFLTVEDDGRGFDTEHSGSAGVGLKSIENRIALLNGRLEIESKPGNGTTIHIEIPIEDGKKD
jgi:two-component system, NarL family, sensor kinase